MLRFPALTLVAAVLMSSVAFARDWESMAYTPISSYQAVNADGSSAYPSSGFPVKMYGVVIANTEDWLDPTPDSFFAPYSFELGGESELIVQAVGAGDFGGVFCWMGQNYGNTYRADPTYSYTDTEWTAELGRLGLYGGDGVTDPIRAGTLVEIRAHAGLNYGGKMNVNEQHDNDRPDHDPAFPAPTDGSGAHDFDIIVLDTNYGLPTPTDVPLNLIKDSANSPIFDDTRATGGEHYQGTLVDLKNVKVLSGTWGSNQTVTVQDASGRTLDVYLGLNTGFNTTQAPPSYFNAEGIVDQKSDTGRDGYRLLALDPSGVIRHGDADKDHNVSIQDFNLVLQNYTGFAGTGKTWAEGNFNQAENGAVDIYDFNATIANFTGFSSYGPEAAVGDLHLSRAVAPQLAAGEAQLIVDLVTGELTLVGDAAQINNWDIYSPSGSLVPDADGSAGPWTGYLINNTFEVAAYAGIGSFVSVDGELLLDMAFDLAGTMDLQFLYAGTDGNLTVGNVVTVPEPTTLAVFGLGAAAVLRHRRA